MKLHKITSLILAMILLISSVAFAANEIRVMLDDEYIKFDVAPQIVNGRTMVPLRAIFEAMGADIEWDGDTSTVAAIKDETVVVAVIGSKIMYVNDDEKIIDVPPMIVGGRTLVPVRFITEAFGYEVSWDSKNRRVIISSGE